MNVPTTFFYQLLAGALPDERDAWGLEDASDYMLLHLPDVIGCPGGLSAMIQSTWMT